MNRLVLVLMILVALIATVVSARWIDDQVAIQTEEVGKVIFSHYDHLDAVGRDCPTCHNQIFDVDRKKNKHFSMADMEQGKSCGVCHNGKRAFSVSGDCTTCHAGDVIIGGAKFPHEIHVDAFGCSDCHPDLFEPHNKNKPVSMAQMADGESCGACHDGDSAFSVAGDCMTCHTATRDVEYSTAGAGKILFSHEVHVDMFQCTRCHYDVVKSGPKQPTTMAQMEKGRSCGACHNGDTAFPVTEDCSSCHPTKDIDFATGSGGKVLFSHEIHTDMFGCSDCHSGIFVPQEENPPVSMSQMEKGKSCGACHNGNDAFAVSDCSSCHPTQDITFSIESAGKVVFSHDIHTGMYSCSDCHLGLFGHSTGNAPVSMAKMEEGQSCGACHNGDDAFSVAEDCSSCHPTRDITFDAKGAGATLFSHDIHTGMYSCSDCHSDIFAPKTGNPPVSMSQMEQGKSCGACHNGDDAFSVAEDCSSCHPSPSEVTFKTAGAGNIAFSHSLHIDMYGCSDCHSDIFTPKTGNPPVSMSQMEQGKSCGACHNGDDAFSVAEDCSSCHPTREITFKEEDLGNVLFSHGVHTDMYGCSDCHSDIFAPKTGNPQVSMEQMEGGASCGACHNGDDAFSVAEDCETCHLSE